MKLTDEEQAFTNIHPELNQLIKKGKLAHKNKNYTVAIKTYSTLLEILSNLKTPSSRTGRFILTEKIHCELADSLARQAHPENTECYETRTSLLKQALNLVKLAIDNLDEKNAKKLNLGYMKDQLATRLSLEYYNQSIDLLALIKDKPSSWRASIDLLFLSYKINPIKHEEEHLAFAEQFERYADFLFGDIETIDPDNIDINTVIKLYDYANDNYQAYYANHSTTYLEKRFELIASKLNFYETTLRQQPDQAERMITSLATQLITPSSTLQERETGYAYLFSQAIRLNHKYNTLTYARNLIKVISQLPDAKSSTYHREYQKAKDLLEQHTPKVTTVADKPAAGLFHSGLSPKKYWLKMYETKNDENTPNGNTPKRQKISP